MSSTLNILCSICSEFFRNTDVIYSTRCGHVFHKLCIFRWLKCSNTCPQCRKQCFQRNCHQLFVNFVERTDDDESKPEIDFPKCYEWIYLNPFMIEHNDYLTGAFKFGQDEVGNDIYAARGEFNGDLIPAYYAPQKKSVIAPWGFQSHRLHDDVELLDISNDNAEYKWVPASDGAIPENAFATGHTSTGDILYTARAEHDGVILYGKLDRRYNLAYMPFNNLEVSNSNYEILVRIPKETSITTSPANNSSDCNASNN